MMQQTAANPAAGEFSPAIASAVLALLRQVLPQEAHGRLSVEDDVALTDLGLTSMGKIALVYKLEKQLDMDLSGSPEAVADIVTVRDVVAFVSAIAARRGR
jgi:acyl carrier protein